MSIALYRGSNGRLNGASLLLFRCGGLGFVFFFLGRAVLDRSFAHLCLPLVIWALSFFLLEIAGGRRRANLRWAGQTDLKVFFLLA